MFNLKKIFGKKTDNEKLYKLKYLKSESTLFVQIVLQKFFSFPPDKIDVRTLSFLFDELSITEYSFLNHITEEEIAVIFHSIVKIYNLGLSKNNSDKFDELKRGFIVYIARIFDEFNYLEKYTDKDVVDLFINLDTFKNKF